MMSDPTELSIPAWFDWRDTPSCCPAPAWWSFQSQLGSIGAPSGWQILSAHVAFNPSLVRLAPMLAEAWTSSRVHLSIPAWFDWRKRLPEPLNEVQLLSIPAWFDWRPAHVLRWRGFAQLSIPAWFDWRPGELPRPRPRSTSFNPSLVRLAPTTFTPT